MSNVSERLTVAQLTAVGRGAVATIRVVGDVSKSTSTLNSLFRAANGIALTDQPVHKISFGKWGRDDGEDLVVCRVSGRELEIHCHGGDAAVRRVLNDLVDIGCSICDWQDQPVSASDTLETEFMDVLSRTTTWRTTEFVLEQSNGLLRSAFEQLAATMPDVRVNSKVNGLQLTQVTRSTNEVSSEPEAKIDVDGAPATLQKLRSRSDAAIDELLRWANFGRHLTEPWDVVLTGRPNVGKSSLINALLGYQRAIVFDEPGTTRDVVTGETAFDGWPVMLADTAGMRDDARPLEAAGMELARERLQRADLCVVLIDLSQPPTVDDDRILKQWPTALVVAHKADLTDCWGDRLPLNSVKVSSLTGTGISELQQQLVQRLVPEIPTTRTPIPISSRQVELLKKGRSTDNPTERQQTINKLFLQTAEV